jgi:hypothetical protein
MLTHKSGQTDTKFMKCCLHIRKPQKKYKIANKIMPIPGDLDLQG